MIKLSKKAKTVVLCTFVLFGMLGLSFAAVPLYDMFCKVTGFGGTPIQVSANTSTRMTGKKIRINFDVNIRDQLPWAFYPETPFIDVDLGQTVTVNFHIEGRGTDKVGISTFNVTPENTSSYFNKLQCFCFEDLLVKSGDKKVLPVTFYIDPEILKNADAGNTKEITLSYTYFQSKKSIAEVQAIELNKQQ